MGFGVRPKLHEGCIMRHTHCENGKRTERGRVSRDTASEIGLPSVPFLASDFGGDGWPGLGSGAPLAALDPYADWPEIRIDRTLKGAGE